MVEQGRIFKFLAGLDDELDEVRARIIGRHTLLSPGEVFSEIRREANRRSVMLVPVSTDTTTLVAVGASANKSNHSSQSEPRHTRDTCRRIHGRPAHSKANKTGPKVSN